MSEPHEPNPRALWLERAQALCALLPALLLAWPGPGAPLALDPAPALSGAGWAALAALPCGLLVLLRGAWRAPPALLLYALFAALGHLGSSLLEASDTLEAARAGLLTLATSLTLLGGASLDREGRRWLAGGLGALAALLLAPTLVGPAPSALHGAFGNAGTTSDVALGGLCVACLALVSRRRGVALAAFLLLGLGVLHAARAPVLTTPAILGLLLAALALAQRGLPRRGRWLLALAALILVGVTARRMQPAPPPSPAAAQRAVPEASDLRGLEVRAGLARASARLFAAHLALGVGRGQFTAAFPPWRDPAEIALSTLDHNLVARSTEVEHPHDDWLLGLLETGLLGGLVWLAFLLLCARAGLRAVRAGELALAGLGAAAMGWLVAALLRGTLLYEPGSACAAFAVFGACLAAPAAPARRPLARLLLNAALILSLFAMPRALALVRHGRALAELGRSDADGWQAVQDALAACPDSVLARAHYARLAPLEARARGAASPPDVVPLWRAVLELRPHHFEAWVNLGNAWARAQRLDEAREAYLQAHALDAQDPPLLRNLARLEIAAGRTAEALAYVDVLERERRLPPGWLEGAVAAAARDLRPETAVALLRRARPDWLVDGPQALWDRAQDLPEDQTELADALLGLAHLTWAREQIAAGDAATAVRSYRQALRRLGTRPGPEEPWQVAPILRLELAAAFLRAGMGPEATQEAARARPSARDLLRLPPWAGDELMAGGLIGR